MVCSGVDWWVACVRVRVRAAGEEVRVRRVHSRALLQKSFILLYLLLDSPDTHIATVNVRIVPGTATYCTVQYTVALLYCTVVLL